MIDQNSARLLKTGVVGSAITSVCCFTPVLVGLLSVVGLGSLSGYLDYVLLPALGIFLTTTGYALIRRQERRCNPCEKRRP